MQSNVSRLLIFITNIQMIHSDKQMFWWLIELSNVSQRLTNVSSTTKRPNSQSNVSSISLSVITNANVTKLYQLFLTGKGVA